MQEYRPRQFFFRPAEEGVSGKENWRTFAKDPSKKDPGDALGVIVRISRARWRAHPAEGGNHIDMDSRGAAAVGLWMAASPELRARAERRAA